MVVYNCQRCGYSTNNKSYIRKHFERKIPCKVVLKDIPVEILLQEIMVEKTSQKKNLEHFKKNTKNKKNITKNVTKSNLTKNNAKSRSKSFNIKNGDGTILHKKTNKNHQNSVNISNLTLEPPESSNIEYYENNTFGQNLQKNDVYIDRNLGQKKGSCVNISNLTSEPPKSSIKKPTIKNTTGENLQKKDVYISDTLDQKMQGSVNISHLTSESPETSIHNCNRKITPRENLQKKDVYANSPKNFSVNISNLTSDEGDSITNQYYKNSQPGPIVQNNHVYAKPKYMKQSIHSKKSRTYSNRKCYKKQTTSSKLHNSKYNQDYGYSSLSSDNDNPKHKSNNNRSNNADYTNNNNNYTLNSQKNYNNFNAPPVMQSTQHMHHSPTKFITTKLDIAKNNNEENYSNQNNYPINSDEESETEEESHCCTYCGRIFKYRQSKWRHEKKCSSKNILADKCNMLEQQNKEKDVAIELLKRQMELMMEKVGSEVYHNTTNNYTVNFVLNAYGNERIDYLNSNKVRQIIQQGGAMESIPKLLKAIHFHPEHTENHNVMIPNRKENIAKIWDGNRWILQPKNRTLNEMTDKAYNIINEHYEDGNKQFEEFTHQYANDDKRIKKRVVQDTELMIINSSNNDLKQLTNNH